MPSHEDPKAARARARVGTVVRGKWRLDALLGIGGTATVYAATHRNAKRVAIKMLHPELSLDAEARARFVREGYAANRIGHDGAVSVLDDDLTDDGQAFLVMELLDGETFEQRWELAGHALPPAEVLSLVDPVLDVLAAAHEQGIIHRDLKPENMFLTRDGRVKVLDFGLARLRDLADTSRITVSRDAIMGTPAFMSPEQARGRRDGTDARTDLWALGASMYTLVSGKYVHEGTTVQEILVSALTRPVGSVSSVLPGLPSAVAELIDRALAFAPADRWPDARTMQRALREAYLAITGKSIISSGRPTVLRQPAPELNPTLVSGPALHEGTTPPPIASTRSARAPSARTLGVVVAVCAIGGAALLAIRLWRSPPHTQGEAVVEVRGTASEGHAEASVAPVVAPAPASVDPKPPPASSSAAAPPRALPRPPPSARAAPSAGPAPGPAATSPHEDPLDRRR